MTQLTQRSGVALIASIGAILATVLLIGILAIVLPLRLLRLQHGVVSTEDEIATRSRSWWPIIRSLNRWLIGGVIMSLLVLITPVSYGIWTTSLSMDVSVTTAGPITASIEIVPETLNDKSEGQWIMAKIEFPADLPPDCTVWNIDTGTVRIRVLGATAEVPAAQGQDEASEGGRKRHFKFDRDAVIALTGEPARDVTLEVLGSSADCDFSGTGTIRFIHAADQPAAPEPPALTAPDETPTPEPVPTEVPPTEQADSAPTPTEAVEASPTATKSTGDPPAEATPTEATDAGNVDGKSPGDATVVTEPATP
jgi:hypothetical protein